MKYTVYLLLLFCTVLPAQGLRGGSGTDIDDYCAVFNQKIIDSLSALYARWQQNTGWNKYRVMLLGNSNTHANYVWEPFNNAVFGLANATQVTVFKDSTFAQSQWCTHEMCKDSIHGNQGGARIDQVDSWTYMAMANTKPMIASIMIGTNNVNVGGESWATWPDTVEFKQILDKLVPLGIMPIITSLPPIDGDHTSWTKPHDPDTVLIPYNNKLRALAAQRGYPFIDLYQWCMDHGGTGLLQDWAHSYTCGNTAVADLTDSCLAGGEGKSFYNAWNYLLLIAVNDIVRYVVDGEPLDARVQEQRPVDGEAGIEVWPNPFNPSTTINFKLEILDFRLEDVKIGVYDVTGRCLEAIHESSLQTPGNNNLKSKIYNLKWSASDLPSGIYLLRASLNGRVFQKRITLLR